MLLYLQARGRASARELADALEVCPRTVYRDLDALSAAGVPVHAERGNRGGIVLADGYRRALTQFREDEIRALFVSAENPLADLGMGDGLRHALEKLAGALPESQRSAIAKTRSRVFIDARRWKQADPPRLHLAALRRAVWDDRKVRLRYRDRNRAVTERVIDPFGLVAKAGVWYLVARWEGQMRTFRAERVLGVDELLDRFERPPDFDLDAYWREWAASYESSVPAFEIVLLVRPDALEGVTDYWESEDQGVVSADEHAGWHRVRQLFHARHAAIVHVLAWADEVRIVEPADLAAQLADRARRTLRILGQSA